MPFRSSAAAWIALVLLLLGAAPARAADFIDDAERHVSVPDTILRVMPANQAAAVLVYVLNPNRLIGWSRPLPYAGRRFILSRYRRLPAVGRLFGPAPTTTIGAALRRRPDLIVYYGAVSPRIIAFAEQVQRLSGVATIVLNNSIGRSHEVLRRLGALLGVAARGDVLALYAEHAIDAIRGTLLIQPVERRPLVYYGRGFDGLESGLDHSAAMAALDEAGAINVAGSLGRGGLTRVSAADIRFWRPDFIIAERRRFYDALLHERRWRGLAAVRNHRVFLEPADPFGWIDDPPSVNRLIGLYWLSTLFYKGVAQPDLNELVSEFYQTFYGVKLTAAQLTALLRTAEPPAPAQPAPVAPPTTPAPPLTLPPASTGIPGVPGIGNLPSIPGGANIPNPAPGSGRLPAAPGRTGLSGDGSGINPVPALPNDMRLPGETPNPGIAPQPKP